MQNRIDPIVPAGTPGTVTFPITGHTLCLPRVALETHLQYMNRVSVQCGAGGDPGGILNAEGMGQHFGGDPDATGDNWAQGADYAFNASQYRKALGLTGDGGAWLIVEQRAAAGVTEAAPVAAPDVPGTGTGGQVTWVDVYSRIGAFAPGGAPQSTATPPVPAQGGSPATSGGASFDFGLLALGAQTHDFPTSDADTVVCSWKLPDRDSPAGNMPHVGAVEYLPPVPRQRRAWLNTTGKAGDGFEMPPGSSVGTAFMVGDGDPGNYGGYDYPRFARGADVKLVIQTQGGDPSNPVPAGLHVTLAGWAGM